MSISLEYLVYNHPASIDDVSHNWINSDKVGLPTMYRRLERSEPLSVQQRNGVSVITLRFYASCIHYIVCFGRPCYIIYRSWSFPFVRFMANLRTIVYVILKFSTIPLKWSH